MTGQYVDTLTGNLVSAGWAAEEYDLRGAKYPLLPGVVEHCNLAEYTAATVDPDTEAALNTATEVSGVWTQDKRYKTEKEQKQAYTAPVQMLLDEKAREYGYDSVLSACSYAASADLKFGPEGLAFVNWRDACWSKCYQMLADYMAGDIPKPTVSELLAQLPVFVAP